MIGQDSQTRDEDPIGLSVQRRGDSFHFDELIDSLGEDRSSQLATSLDHHNDTSAHSVAFNATPPSVPMVKSKSSNSVTTKVGFFKRLFSNSNVPPNWASQTENQIGEEDNKSITSSVRSSLRNRTSSLFRRPETKQSVNSTLTTTTESTDSRASPSLPQSRGYSFTSSTRDVASDVAPALPSLQSMGAAMDEFATLSLNPSTNGARRLEPMTRTSSHSDGHLPSQKSSIMHPQEPEEVPISCSDEINTPPSSHFKVTTRDSSLVHQSHPPRDPLKDNAAAHLVLKDVSNSKPLIQQQTSVGGAAPSTAVLGSSGLDNVLESKMDNQKPPQAAGTDTDTEIQVRATAFYEWQDSTMHPSEYAAYLGTDKDFNHAVCQAYLDLFDFQNKSIIRSLRHFCSKLYIRGETQVIDRVLEAFSRRWYLCNRQDPYLTQEITHIIAFALITLNTDLHVANLESDQKMKKSAFTNNTMAAIHAGIEADKQADSQVRSQLIFDQVREENGALSGHQTIRFVPRSFSLDDMPEHPTLTSHDDTTDVGSASESVQASAQPTVALRRKLTLRKHPSFMGDEKSNAYRITRDAYLKDALQDMYQSVKNEQIRQPELGRLAQYDSTSAARSKRPKPLDLRTSHSARSRSLRPGDMLSRNSSALSLVLPRGSSPLSAESKEAGEQTGSGRSSQVQSQSGQNYTSQRGLGFASSLSNVMTREEVTTAISTPDDVAEAIEAAEEDDLLLYGAPFAKEGRVMHKIYEESNSKKARAKGWTVDTFAVLSKGELKLFDFSQKAMKNNQKLYGGGDWTQSARSLIELSLIQTVAAALPEGTYSKDRPHIWALTMPDGVMHLFHVGTDELVQEWISTVNYWAARTTKEPLLGAVDNAEYGWGSVLDHAQHAAQYSNSAPTTPESSTVSRRDSSSTFSFMLNPDATRFDEIVRKFPGNRAVIRTWQPESRPRLMSTLPQDTQLIALQKFVTRLKGQLTEQNNKRFLLTQAFSPHHPNLIKASNNFDARKQYWQSEIIKYRTYIEALEHGIQTAEDVRMAKLNKNLKDLQT
ncbi:Sec7 domain protein [Taphrina deformans PYCC 5710]|uniref:Sec7 domain protein n=1 Tax=Taphrina deformans (strain PYCC 5710 / ATCC 11124 / CBS 356.35 / IMI 108563 / JCM 9778 / NBRC 8474) TaxID=1097556 RepID=R4XGR6_TAPDE|nr:Sec7 domain protein [Taphrina deformans PYCC 5710]|eukprot:CCG82576.1 Sec7 domain protein [Taphrina deformans PYCC 5710]